MRKPILLLIALIICTFSMSARQISANEAQSSASQFIRSETKLKAPSATNPLVLSYQESAKADESAYYVFNYARTNGYIIVSGDDEAQPILGYSDSGKFDIDNCAPAMKWWLEEYAKQIKALQAGNVKPGKVITRTIAKTVAPLIKSHWNQGAPYNNLMPTVTSTGKNAVTGCVATATSQIMYYWKCPTRGTGSKTMTSSEATGSVQLSADFGNTTYEWDKMTDSYDSSSSEEANNAVALLMLHVGISLDMDYGSSSGASTANVAVVLPNYFGYDKGAHVETRALYKRTDWENILIGELDANRPIQYSGQSGAGGHSFVCDGYDKNLMFHINWGWGGMSDGYFAIDALTPGSQGIGGSTGGFNYSQYCIVGIQPDQGGETASKIICSSSNGMLVTTGESSHIQLGQQASLSATTVYNSGAGDFSGSIFAILVDPITDEIVRTLDIDHNNFTLPHGYGWNTLSFQFVVPTDLPGTRYKVRLATANSSNPNIVTSIPMNTSAPEMIMDIADGYADFTSKANVVNLSATNVTINPELGGKIYKGLNLKVSFDITNNGDEFYDKLYYELYDKNTLDSTKSEELITNIRAGETRNLTIGGNITCDAGNYILVITDDKETPLSDYIDVTVEPEPADPVLVVSNTQLSLGYINKNNLKIPVEITNTGGAFVGEVAAAFFLNGQGSSQTLLRKTVSLPQGKTTVDFGGMANINNGIYAIAIYYLKNNSYNLIPNYFNAEVLDYTEINPAQSSYMATKLKEGIVGEVFNFDIDLEGFKYLDGLLFAHNGAGSCTYPSIPTSEQHIGQDNVEKFDQRDWVVIQCEGFNGCNIPSGWKGTLSEYGIIVPNAPLSLSSTTATHTINTYKPYNFMHGGYTNYTSEDTKVFYVMPQLNEYAKFIGYLKKVDDDWSLTANDSGTEISIPIDNNDFEFNVTTEEGKIDSFEGMVIIPNDNMVTTSQYAIRALTNSSSIPTSVDPIKVKANVAIGVKGAIIVNSVNEAIVVYDLSGSIIAQQQPTTDKVRIEVVPGYYIVKVGKVTTKVATY